MTTSRRLSPLPLRLTALLALLALGGVLLWSTPAEAQTARILVSNVSQSGDDSVSTGGNDHAQLFHTAGATNGYVLTSVIVVSEDTAGDDFDVEICEADADGFPTSTCTALARPGSFAAGNLEFTAPGTGITLNANDNYVVVIKQVGSGSVTLDSTTSGGQDSTGLTGWSIKDKFDWNNGGTWQHKGGSNEAIQITVNGYERPANQDATGRPTVLASAEDAGVLAVDTSGIGDPDGLVNVGDIDSTGILHDWSYRWIRVDGDTQTVVGTDSARYRRVEADIGKLIQADQGAGVVHGPVQILGDRDQPAVRPARQTPVAARIDAGQQHGPVALSHGDDHPAVRDGVQVGHSRPGLRDLERLDRAGRGPVQSDRVAVDGPPSWA